jgi:hypothetical protein
MFLRVFKRLALGLLILASLGLGDDVLRLNPAQRAALPYEYSLLRWEAANLLSKWTHRLATALPWNAGPETDRRSQVLEYFRLGGEIGGLGDELAKASARTEDDGGDSVRRLESELARVKATRRKLRNDVEEALEATISAVLVDEDISSWGELIIPPVDFRLSDPPKLLVTSPRDRIERTHDVLLNPDVGPRRSGEIERALMDGWDLSALVTTIGGVATYPAAIVSTLSLQATLELAAHEWLHHYLSYRPLGRNMFSGPQMQTLNETMADVAGREIAASAYRMLVGTPALPSPGVEADPEDIGKSDEKEFDFAGEMRETRQRVDELLADGAIQEAEAYMEERRELFVDNGFHIRVLNQAYFAFNGTYAESPASVSPIADQLHRFRALTPDLGTFVETMSKVSSYRQFLDALNRLKVEAR